MLLPCFLIHSYLQFFGPMLFLQQFILSTDFPLQLFIILLLGKSYSSLNQILHILEPLAASVFLCSSLTMLTNSYHILPLAFFLVILLIQKAISVKTLSISESISQDMCTLMNMNLFLLLLYPLVHPRPLAYIPLHLPFLYLLYLHNPLIYLLIHLLLPSLLRHHHLHSLLIHSLHHLLHNLLLHHLLHNLLIHCLLLHSLLIHPIQLHHSIHIILSLHTLVLLMFPLSLFRFLLLVTLIP